MWKVLKILEADFGCEERQPGEKQKAIVYLTDELGKEKQLIVEDDWLIQMGIEENSIWFGGKLDEE